jgi:hypothetical protein
MVKYLSFRNVEVFHQFLLLFSNKKTIVKENIESSTIFYLLKWEKIRLLDHSIDICQSCQGTTIYNMQSIPW